MKFSLYFDILSEYRIIQTIENIRLCLRYENMSIQIYWKFYHPKNENLLIKNSDILNISAQNIDCGYSLEPPRRGGSTIYGFEQK